MATAPPPKLLEYQRQDVVEAYDRRWAGASGRRRNRRKARALERALDVLEVRAGEPLRSLLDAPCGNGRFAALLCQRAAGYVGLDFSTEMLAAARGREPAASLLRGDLFRLPLADGSFDVVTCVRFLHLLRDPALRASCLRELRRVARLGVVLDYRHDRTLRVWLRRLRHRLGLLPRPPANPSPAAIQGELEAAGLRPLQWIAVHRAPLLSDKVLVVAACAAGPAEAG